VDRGGVDGPIAGISAALAEFPDAAWLVLACDLPFLGARTLDALIAARDTAAEATAFRSSHDGLPEPLCAIYEPRAREPMAAHIAGGRNCPRKFLISAKTRLLEQPNPRALDNVNTVAEYGAAMSASDIRNPQARESACSTTRCCVNRPAAAARHCAPSARTPRELYAELRAKYPFTLPRRDVARCVNEEFGDWTQPLAAGDAVVFIPPVAGG
jgi:molybdopterin-guanine dinucleotide biosynthesis protein A